MTDRHEHLDEGTIHAWLDGALSPDESARVEAAANSCNECSALVAEARGLIAASSRILSSLDAVPAGVIPGNAENVDQLAALRARHQVSTKRSWWNDRRLVAAASIAFVAGVSTMVWRYAPESARSPIAQRVADAVQPVGDSASPVASEPPPEKDVASQPREAPARSLKVEASVPAAPTPAPVAVRSVDTAAERKVAATTTSLARNSAANEAKQSDSSLADRARQAESRREARADALSPVQQQSLRQQGAPSQQQGAVGQQQGFSQLRPDTMRVNAPPPSIGAGARVAPMVARAAASADAVAGTCYRLRALVENERFVPDTVQLLNEILPIERDPSWYRARTFGTVRDTTFAWRMLDSLTVELRTGFGSGGVRLLFVTNGAYQDLSIRSADVRIAASERITCPR